VHFTRLGIDPLRGHTAQPFNLRRTAQFEANLFSVAVTQKIFGQRRTVAGRSGLVGNDGDGALKTGSAQTAGKGNTGQATAQDDHRGRGRGRIVVHVVGLLSSRV
jgi:hypothetical protein